MTTWGITAKGHDAAIAVVDGAEILFAGHAERYSKIKNDPALHTALVDEALKYGGQPDRVVWYEKPILKAMRGLRSGRGFLHFHHPWWTTQQFGLSPRSIETVEHHEAHAAGGFFTSPFDEAAVVVIDAIGEFDTTTIWDACGPQLTKRWKRTYPDSLGLFYSAMTDRVGLKPNEEEYILMGMAAYGKPKYFWHMVRDFFDHDGEVMSVKVNLHQGCREWMPELKTEQDYFDIAKSAQLIYETAFENVLAKAKRLVPSENLVLTGGCALNCHANRLVRNHYQNVWIMPNPGDAGSSLGAVAAVDRRKLNWTGPYLGHNIEGTYPDVEVVNALLRNGIAGVAAGRAEFGPRALGNRSLLADPRGPHIKDQVNQIKRRQEFRPFAPAILEEYAQEFFDMKVFPSPYMQFTAKCKFPYLFPAIVHADGTSRVQTVSREDNPGFYGLLRMWNSLTGCPMLLNTSLNIRGMPLVNTIEDARQFQELYKIPVFTPNDTGIRYPLGFV